MSFILKALKQAQESRSIDGRPVTAATQRVRSGERPRQIPWRWIAAAALVLNGLVLLLVLFLPRFGSQAPPPTLLPASAPTIATPPPPPVVSPPPTVTVTPAPRVAVQSPPTAAPAPTIAAQPATPAPPPVRSPAIPAPRPKPVEPARQPTVASRAPERASIEPAERPSGDRPAPVAPQSSPPPAVAAVTPPPATPEIGPELRDAMEKFKLEVLVWAADPRDRMVFLSGRKFVEGQSLDGKVVVERINDDSITLGYQGQRVRVKRP